MADPYWEDEWYDDEEPEEDPDYDPNWIEVFLWGDDLPQVDCCAVCLWELDENGKCTNPECEENPCYGKNCDESVI